MWDHANSDISHGDWCDGVKDEDGTCPVCEARIAEEMAHYRPLYEGEKAAGLHGEFAAEGLSYKFTPERLVRRISEITKPLPPDFKPLAIDDARAMGGYDPSDRDGEGSWSGGPARFSK